MAAMATDEVGDGMHCSDHPYRSNPGGICAFCLQEKLGKLVSSSSSTSSTTSSMFPPLPPISTSTSSSTSSTYKIQQTSQPAPLAAILALKRSNSVAPRPASAAAADTPRKKSFWSFHRKSADPQSADSEGKTVPRSPWSASTGERKEERARPREARLWASLWATKPDLPNLGLKKHHNFFL